MSKEVTREDLEKKLREIKGEIDGLADTAKPAVSTIAGLIGAGIFGVAYVAGQRRAKNQKTIVEVKRV